MNRYQLFRLMKCALCVVFVASCLIAGCQATPAETTLPATSHVTTALTATTVKTTEAKTTEAIYPFKETLKITVFQGSHPQHPTERSAIDNKLDEILNTKITYIKVPNASYNEKLTSQLASGNIPDIIVGGTLDFLISQDVVLPLDDYLSKFMPNMKAFIDKYNADNNINVWSYIKAATDGKLYTLPKINGVKELMSIGIRSDWLEALKLKMPVTLDDWVVVLKAFRDNDVNGNGKKDEVPFAGPLHPFFHAFGVNSNARFMLSDGKFIPIYEHKYYKEALQFISNLYKEKLIDQEYLINNEQAVKNNIVTGLTELWNNSLAGSGYWSSQIIIEQATAAIQQVKPTGIMKGCVVPVGPHGDQILQGRSPINSSIRITKSAQKKGILEQVLRYCDWGYTAEGIKFFSFGIEGKHYNLVNGKPFYIKPYGEGWISKRAEGIDDDWKTYYLDPESYKQSLMGGVATVKEMPALSALNYEALYLNSKYLFAPLPSFSTPATVEKGTSIYTKLDENVDKVIMGKITVDDFFKEYEQIKSSGFAQIYSETLDAYNKVK